MRAGRVVCVHVGGEGGGRRRKRGMVVCVHVGSRGGMRGRWLTPHSSS